MQTVVRSSQLSYLVIASAALAAVLFAAAPAYAVGLRVRMACAGDYLRLCSQFVPTSPEARDCMDEHGKELSTRCIAALIAEGEISKEQLAERSGE